MWPFRQKTASPELEERIAALERQMRSLRLDWDETYDKVARMMSRIAKRSARDAAAAAAADEETREVDPGSTITNGRPLDPFSQQVLALRHHGRAG